MWTHEDGVETTAAPEAIWMLWADVEGWPSWNGDIEHIEIDGPFATGHVIAMTPVGQEPVRLRIAEVSADVKMTSQVLRSLERKGLLERAVDPRDTRAKRIRVTRLGEKLAPRAIDEVERVDGEFFAAIPHRDAIRLLGTLAGAGASDPTPGPNAAAAGYISVGHISGGYTSAGSCDSAATSGSTPVSRSSKKRLR